MDWRSFGRATAFGVAWSLLFVMSSANDTAAQTQGVIESRSESLTLLDARAQARKVSPDLAAAREAVAVARGQEKQAGAFPNPSVSWSHEETSQDGETNREDIALIEQPLEIAGQRGLRRSAASQGREAAEARLAVAELDLDFEVARAFAQTLAADRRASHAHEAAEAFARARTISQERLQRGDVSGYEARRTSLEAARYAALHADAERAVRTARAQLRSLMSPSPESGPPWAGRVEEPSPWSPLVHSLESLRTKALDAHPAIRFGRLERQASETRARLSRREIVPDPTLGLGYKREKAAGASGSWDGFAAQVTLPLPLWNRSSGTVDAADAKARSSAAELRKTRRRIALDVERAWYEYLATSQQLETLRPLLGDEARAAIGAARTAYEEGEIALLEWLDAVRAYYEAETAYAGLLADYLIRHAALERAVGGPLE